MNPILIFILGVIVGVITGLIWVFCRKKNKVSLIKQQAEEKQRNKTKILELLENRGRLANDQIEQALSISDATATRYLEELEQEGKIKQVGQTGKHVYYEKT